MPIVNPYAQKKAVPATKKPLVDKSNNAVPKEIKQTASAKKLKPTKEHAATAPPRQAVAAVRMVTPSSKTNVASARKKPASFKTQLKQQIQELKRQKKLAQERKLMEKRLKEREAEKERREEERKKLALEMEKKRQQDLLMKEQERKRKEEERLRLQAEKQKQREIKAAETLAKEQEKERIRAEKELARAEKQRQQEVAYQQRMMAYQENQMLQYGFVPQMLPAYPYTPHAYQSNPSFLPAYSTPIQPVMSSATSQGTDLMKISLIPYPPQPQLPPVPNSISPVINQASGFTDPRLTSSAHLVGNQNLPFQPYQQRTPMAPPARYSFQQRRPAPLKILSRQPLEAPSPFSSTYEILEHLFVIYKETGVNFGVSVEIQTQSTLVEPDVWDTLHNAATKSTNPPVKTMTLPKTPLQTIPVVLPLQKTDTSVSVPAISKDKSDAAVAASVDTAMSTSSDQQLGKVVNAETSIADMAEKQPTRNEPVIQASNNGDLDMGRQVDIKEEVVEHLIASQVSHEQTQHQDLGEKIVSSSVALETPKINEDAGIAAAKPVSECTQVQPNATIQPRTPNTILDTNKAEMKHEGQSLLGSVHMPQPVGVVSSNYIKLQTDVTSNQKQKRRRRKRAFFHVMSVMDASKQNSTSPETDLEKQLKQGDLILEINGAPTGGLSFHKACQLFASAKAEEPVKDEKVIIRCTLMVARRKQKAVQVPPPPRPPQSAFPKQEPCSIPPSAQQGPSSMTACLKQEPASTTPCSVNIKTEFVATGDFTIFEMVELLRGIAKTLVSSLRPLGYEASKEAFSRCISLPGLVGRDQYSIKKKLNLLVESLETEAANAANAFWKQDWLSKYSDAKIEDTLKLDFLTPTQLSDIRALPRPLRGCRCGSNDHDYVNSPKCFLYQHLCKSTGKSPEQIAPVKMSTMETSLKDLSAMESAFKDRVVRDLEEQQLELAETKFVNEMEKVQIRNLKRAVFAPNFTVMVLCAVAELGVKFDDSVGPFPVEESTQEVQEALPNDATMEGENNNEEDEDNLPLFSLGKRAASDDSGSPAKKTKADSLSFGYHPAFLAQLLRYMSQTWGHVYRESSHGDYTWRWEVHHGQTSDTKRENCKNPRAPGTLSLANVEFAVGDVLMECVGSFALGKLPPLEEDTKSKSRNWVNDMLRIAHLVSPQRTGLLDELLALEQVGILCKSKHGGAMLAKDWFTRVDPLILDDMDSKWSYEADPDNKYLISGKVKRDLANYWMRIDGAWALNEDLSEMVFLDDEWDDWRRSFEDDNEKRADIEDGIGKFGL